MYPPFDCVETVQYILPPLHLRLGITNHILNDFYAYIQKVLENVRKTIIELQRTAITKEQPWIEAKAVLESFNDSHAEELVNERLQRKEIQ